VAAGADGAATTMTEAGGPGATERPDASRRSPAEAGRRPPADARRRPSKPPAGWVFAPALGAFFAALALLAFQVRAGQDPALGPAEPAAAQAQPKPRRILIRRVIERVVVHHPPTGTPAPAQTREPAATTSAPAPATTSAPAPAAPAPAPEPAPAPAPLTPHSS
jgi:hypothetical protein